MPRESPDYRETLRLLNEKFGDRIYLTIQEVMSVTGYSSRNSIYKFFPVKNGRVNKVTLARYMSQGK